VAASRRWPSFGARRQVVEGLPCLRGQRERGAGVVLHLCPVARSARHHREHEWPPGRSGASDRACLRGNPASSAALAIWASPAGCGPRGVGARATATLAAAGSFSRPSLTSAEDRERGATPAPRVAAPRGPLPQEAVLGLGRPAGRQAKQRQSWAVARVPVAAGGAARSRRRVDLPRAGIGPEQLAAGTDWRWGLRRPSVPAQASLWRRMYARGRRTPRLVGEHGVVAGHVEPGTRARRHLPERVESPGWIGRVVHAGGVLEGGFRRRTRRQGGGRSSNASDVGEPLQVDRPSGRSRRWYRRMDSGRRVRADQQPYGKRPGRRRAGSMSHGWIRRPEDEDPLVVRCRRCELAGSCTTDVAAGERSRWLRFGGRGRRLVEDSTRGPAGGRLEISWRLRSLWPSTGRAPRGGRCRRSGRPSSPARPGKEGLSAPGGP